MTHAPSPLCTEVAEDLARILDGTAAPELHDHIADCDACRDLRHEASRVLDRVRVSGDDYVPIPDLDLRLLRALDERPAATSSGPTSGTLPVARPAESAPASLAPADSKPAVTEQLPLSPGAFWTAAPPASEAAAAPLAARDRKVQDDAPAAPQAAPGHLVIALPSRRRLAVGAGLVSLVAMAAGGLLFLKNHSSGSLLPSLTAEPWSGEVKSLARSAAGAGGSGLVRCDAAGSTCADLRVGDPIPVGSLLRTDKTTRAQIHLADGSEFVLDHSSEFALRDGESRSARVLKGSLVADIAHLDHGPNAHLILPGGKLEVLGTRFAVDASADRSRVAVSRGVVQLTDDRGGTEKVLAGEEGRLVPGAAVSVAPSPSLAEGFAWSERVAPARVVDPVEAKADESADLRGLGELRARKPGQTEEKGGAVRLVRHDVKVRIVDNVARTEIDESFQNDTGEELEGIFRFPLPPDAQIERLALEVNGKLEEGAFVEKEKGAAIWRGVIQNAVPKAPRPVEEIIWVPGPWRDPALLEWKRGGRFELRIFPIPARGQRRIILAYTQTVAPVGGVRRYTYPLPHDGRGAGAIENFRVDAQVLGHDKSQGVRATGYQLASAPGSGEGERLTMAESKFVPSGDLSLEYTLPDAKAELSTWAYQPQGDESPYVALALRPKLPRRREAEASEQVIVVDTSRSMVGERLGRARAVVRAMVKEVGDQDRVQVLACDSECVAWPAGSTEGGAEASANVDRFLSGIVPDGASDLASMVRQARAAGEKTRGDRTLRIVYVGDGAASVGPTKPDHLTAEIKRSLGTSGASVHAVAIGADADTGLLGALARGGGGVLVPYVPGERASEVALAAENAVNGVTLREAELVLPAGFVTVAPSTLDTIRAGSETVIVGRMTSKEIEGEAVLRGKVGGTAFEQKYPLHVIATTEAGNGFVPRLYAAGRIADLERSGGEGSKAAMVELSKKFSVASRHTSLLVLESEAMMTAFGLKRAVTPLWTGEVAATGTTTRGDSGAGEDEQQADPSALGGIGTLGHGVGGGGRAAGKGAMALDRADPFASPPADAPSPAQAAPVTASMGPMADAAGAAAPRTPMGTTTAAPAPPPPPAKAEAKKKDVAADKELSQLNLSRRDTSDDFPMRRQRMVAMKKVWDRKGTFIADLGAWHDRDGARIIAAEGATAAKPDSRQATRDLFALYEQHGRMDRASEIAQRWATRDALDPEALLARADVAARGGDRKLAIRILGSVVDIRPDDAILQNRLASLYEQLGDRGRACGHRIALAEQKADDLVAQASAIRCTRTEGMTDLSDRLLADVASDKKAAVQKALDNPPNVSTDLRGDVRMEASWETEADLDLALIDKNGQRLSWLGGGKAGVSFTAPTGLRSEAVAFQGLGAGSYVVEVSRTVPSPDQTPIRGTITLRVVGETRQIPFTLTGNRLEVGRADVSYTSRLVPY